MATATPRDTAPVESRRAAPRSRALRGGAIVFANGISTMKCRLRDESATGAQLILENTIDVPDEFHLMYDFDSRRIACAVCWKKGKNIGVRFIEALTDRRHRVPASPAAASAAEASALAGALRGKAAEMRGALQLSPRPASRLLKRPPSP